MMPDRSSFYLEELSLTERHLDGLIAGTNDALGILASLSNSFKTVEEQTSSFQARCQDLLTDQKRLQQLADEIESDLNYYSYLDTVSRRLNAPGASRLASDPALAEIFDNLDACVAFMQSHSDYKDAESYQARYQSLLTKALHFLETGFQHQLDKVSSEIVKQIAATKSEGTQHALAYGRFEDMVLESWSLIPNIHHVMRRVFTEHGAQAKKENANHDIYANTAQNFVTIYLTIRDRVLKPIVQHEFDQFKIDDQTSADPATRSFLKQSFERAWNEFSLFSKVFSVKPHCKNESRAAFSMLKSASNQRQQLVNIGHLAPVATQVQSTLQAAGLETLCAVMAWLTHEYLMLDLDDEVNDFMFFCQELTAQLLSEHLWAFTDQQFEAEIFKMGQTSMHQEALKIQSAPYPLIGHAVELLGWFDGCMPKERCVCSVSLDTYCEC